MLLTSMRSCPSLPPTTASIGKVSQYPLPERMLWWTLVVLCCVPGSGLPGKWAAGICDELVLFSGAVENMQLTEKLARLQEDGGTDAVAQLQADVALLRAEILRLTDENKRLQTTPKVRLPLLCQKPV